MSTDYVLITEFPPLSLDTDLDAMEDLFSTYCDGFGTGDYVFNENFLSKTDEEQKQLLKSLSHFIKDNRLIDKLCNYRLYRGVLNLDRTKRSAVVELKYHALN